MSDCHTTFQDGSADDLYHVNLGYTATSQIMPDREAPEWETYEGRTFIRIKNFVNIPDSKIVAL